MRNLPLILCLVALAGAIASGVMFYLIGNSKQRLHARWQATEAQMAVTEARLAGVAKTNTELTSRIRSLDTDLARTKRELTASRLSVEQLGQSLNLAEEEQASALAAGERALADLATAHTALSALREQAANRPSAADVRRYRQTIVDMEARIGDLERELVRNNTDPKLIAGRANHAQTIKVGPRNAFVIINFGSDHGAAPNQQFEIKRGPDRLALAEISKVAEHYSIAQVLPETLSGNIRQGDAATLTHSDP